ncbi:hypothetical protein wTpre_591 [Wolbachia endosymbiont of Trichogramma pretiosum]|nr:hypothetical protein wTpre_591 [Wolbachia endosymbiont of Trichogramma pretiosum]
MDYHYEPSDLFFKNVLLIKNSRIRAILETMITLFLILKQQNLLTNLVEITA